ncbi:DUF421 domain-containing protein [Sphingobacterium hungaricum]|uniref:DUF421 domain-containing protein n=1 Tax=Sphingobacterium hungaricum TaxID=2082723 RepID=A0A928US30_9SPHI|nr:YetF domain-containing protein [Sphingobacterium hungaricum]MBE8712165.1 DUF421 domain-containing protein [Sphingobacterium hungaricum]
MDFEKIFLNNTELQFVWEILLRCLVMYILIIVFLRLSGKRGVRQLSIFEITIILSLGSAAGDPMFTEDIPILHAFLVLFSIIVLYRTTTYFMMKSKKIEQLLEGKPICIVEDGLLVTRDVKRELFSHDEFFAELRQQHVEHLGQVRVALLETNGSVSILFYDDDEIKYGLPLFPKAYTEIAYCKPDSKYACMHCGQIKHLQQIDEICSRCGEQHWTLAMKTKRI